MWDIKKDIYVRYWDICEILRKIYMWDIKKGKYRKGEDWQQGRALTLTNKGGGVLKTGGGRLLQGEIL